MTDAAPEVAPRRGREGGRWINERPEPTEFAEWFTTSMKLDPALRHEDYIGGVVLIPAVDSKAKQVTGFSREGAPIIVERPELSYVPYAKVETRTAYYWDLLDAHEEWVGVVEHVSSPRMPIDFVTVEEREQGGVSESGEPRMRTIERKHRTPGALTVLVHQLPDGFSIMSVPVKDGYTHFLCCTIRVSIYDRAALESSAKGMSGLIPLRTGRGTKQVPLLTGYRDNPWADPSSLMKAETGALGRALGFAGIFVIPGSGVATAEDMLEALAQGAPPAEAPPTGNQGPAAPDQAPVRSGAEQTQADDDTLRARAVALYKALSEERPGKAEEFGLWAKERRLASLGDARGATLRGVVRKLERLSEDTEPAATEQPTSEEAADVPAEASSEDEHDAQA